MPDDTPLQEARTRLRFSRLEPGDVESLVATYLAGEATVADLARQFGVDRTTVMRHLRRNGVAPAVERKVWDENTLLEAAAAYESGSSLSRLAAEYEVAPNTVRTRLRRAGVELRPRTGWA